MNRALVIALVVITISIVAIIAWQVWFPVWPVACSTRGCISSQTWAQNYLIQQHFAQATHTQPPTRERVLTSLIRQHLVAHATVKSPVTITDGRKYREDVLNLHDAATVEKLTGLTLEQYDEKIILPYLQQEAVRQDRRIETLDELFKQLSRERWIIILPLHLW